MEHLLTLSVGIGLVMSLLFTELFGLAAGGMVVPGYIALYLDRPITVALTLAAGFFTFTAVRALSSMTILYGRRRTAITILIGFIVGVTLRSIGVGTMALGPEYDVIGFIIPGLIAIWIARQGVVETFTAILTVSVVVRLTLVLVAGEELLR